MILGDVTRPVCSWCVVEKLVVRKKKRAFSIEVWTTNQVEAKDVFFFSPSFASFSSNPELLESELGMANGQSCRRKDCCRVGVEYVRYLKHQLVPSARYGKGKKNICTTNKALSQKEEGGKKRKKIET